MATAAATESAGDAAGLFGGATAVATDADSSDDEDVIVGGKNNKRARGSPHDRLLQVLRGSTESVFSTFLVPLSAGWQQTDQR